MSTVWTVYCHTHIETGRRYIGLTRKSMERRWTDHVNTSKRLTTYFANAIRKYGKEAFSHEVLEICYSVREANSSERKWINNFDTRNPEKGFNLAKGGNHTPHPMSNPWDRPGFREKCIAARNEAWKDPKSRIRASIASREVHSRPEVKRKMSEATKLQFSTLESRKRQSETVKKLWQDPENAEKFMSGFQKSNIIRASKTHCKHGHGFNVENTIVDANGWRYCKRCQSIRIAQKYYDNRTHCKNGHGFSGENIKFSKNGRSRVCILCVTKTHCKYGHEFSGENTWYNNIGEKVCLECRRIRGRASDKKRREKKRRGRASDEEHWESILKTHE